MALSQRWESRWRWIDNVNSFSARLRGRWSALCASGLLYAVYVRLSEAVACHACRPSHLTSPLHCFLPVSTSAACVTKENHRLRCSRLWQCHMTDLTYGYARYPFFSPPIFKSLIGIRCVMWSLSLRIIFFLGGTHFSRGKPGSPCRFYFQFRPVRKWTSSCPLDGSLVC